MVFQLKRLIPFAIIIPLAMICLDASGQQKASVKLKTVVIDAGHGGHDPGAMSSDRKLKESAINLDIALNLGKKISAAYPDVKVIYTRKTDVFIPLAERAEIANRNHADLFISIHVNSARRNSSASGTETFVMGTDKSQTNMEVCKLENSVILLEEDYSTTYQGFDPDNTESYIFFNLMQNAHFEQSIAMASMVQKNLRQGPVTKNRGIKQAPLVVLWKTTMPSVLVETGFISNPSDRKILGDKTKRNIIAGRIFNAFKEFKRQYDAGLEMDYNPVDMDETPEKDSGKSTIAEPETVETEEDKAVESPSDGTAAVYAVQIFATSKKLAPGAAEFKGLTGIERQFINGIYKYSVGNFSKKSDADKKLKEIRKKFPDAFIVQK